MYAQEMRDAAKESQRYVFGYRDRHFALMAVLFDGKPTRLFFR